MNEVIHQPVLVKEILENLPNRLEYFYDWTLWHWWHAKAILMDRSSIRKYIWVDRDPIILKKAKKNLDEFWKKVIFYQWTYDEKLENFWKKYDGMLLDLGVNMEHFKDPKRWFSIKQDWPLDMRFDINQKFTAADLVNNYDLDQFIWIFTKYWDFSEKLSEKIWKTIIDSRKKSKIQTTFQLKNILKGLGLNDKKISVVFQCIRIKVNNELDHLEKFLDKFVNWLNSWWRCFIITYHSIEDRLVKYKFKQLKSKWILNLVNKHVIKPSWEEVKKNRASRSAKLRIVEKI